MSVLAFRLEALEIIRNDRVDCGWFSNAQRRQRPAVALGRFGNDVIGLQKTNLIDGNRPQ